MASVAEYFEKKEHYKPKWARGTRIFGYVGKIPFVGSIIADRAVDQILVHLDLPIKVDTGVNTVIIVKHKDIKQQLKEI